MTIQEELEKLLEEENLGGAYKKLDQTDIPFYFKRLKGKLANLREIFTRDSEKEEDSKFVLPFLEVIQNSLECLELKHKVTGEDAIDFPFSIVPVNSGFPTVKDFALLERDKYRADKILEELPSREKLIGMIRAGVLSSRSIEHEQILLMRYNYFSRVKDANLMPGLSVFSEGPKYCNSKNGKRFYTLNWYCIESGSNIPVFYKMWFTQDARFPPLHDENGGKKEKHIVLEEFIQQTRRGIESISRFATHVDQQIDEIHPKQIKKYTIGPYFDCLTSNSPELEEAFKGVKDASTLRFTVEMVLSVDVTKKGLKGKWDYLKHVAAGKKLVREVYSGVKMMKCGMIAPMRIKQKFARNRDEYGEPREVYGVTESGEVSF